MQKTEQIELKKLFNYIEIPGEREFGHKDFDKNNHIVFVLSGNIEVTYGGLRPRVISGGDMIFLSPLSSYICKTMTEVNLIITGLDSLNHSCDKYIFQNLTAIFSLLKYDFQELEIRPPLDDFLELMKIYLQDDSILPELYVQKLRELFILFHAYYSIEELAMFFYPLLGKNMEFKKMVTDFYPQVKNASELADSCGYSLGVFQRKFKDVFGESVYQWMQKQKAEQIKHRLMADEISLKELTEEFHFASPAHFNKFCKVWFGMTPSEARQTFLLKKKLH